MLSGREGNRRFVVALAIDPSSTYGLGVAYDGVPRLPSTGVRHLNRYFVLQHEVVRAILELRTIVVRVESGSRGATAATWRRRRWIIWSEANTSLAV